MIFINQGLSSLDGRLPLYAPILPNPLFQGGSIQRQQVPPCARHIILPFDLRLDPDAIHKSENRDILGSLFPGNVGVASDGMFVFLYQDPLPPKPWPLTIAGLASYISPGPGPQHSPIPKLRPVHRKNGVIHADRNGRDMKDWNPLFSLIRIHFQGLGISITEVMYWDNFVIIVLEYRNTDMSKLPWMTANILCCYLYEDEMGRPSAPQARRLTDPTPGNPDDSQYDTLQPGLRVTSTYLPSKPGMFLSTTTGVLVRDQVGNKFMTVASHGFPGECGTDVTHPLPAGGRSIGELIMEVSHTDIALVKLRDGEIFSNVIFHNENIQEPVQLKRLVESKDCRRGDPVVLDSPDTGCIDSIFQLTSYQRVPTDDPGVPEQQWVFTTWYYMGQDSGNELPRRMCGSAIWTEDGDVVGFFRYAPNGGPMKDWCVGTAAEELTNRGFTLVSTGDN